MLNVSNTVHYTKVSWTPCIFLHRRSRIAAADYLRQYPVKFHGLPITIFFLYGSIYHHHPALCEVPSNSSQSVLTIIGRSADCSISLHLPPTLIYCSGTKSQNWMMNGKELKAHCTVSKNQLCRPKRFSLWRHNLVKPWQPLLLQLHWWHSCVEKGQFPRNVV